MIIGPLALPIAAAVGQTGLGIFGGMESSANERASSAYNNTYQNLMISAGNRQRRDIFSRQLDQAKTQTGFNADAANRAYTAEQIRLNEQFTAAAFQRQGMLQSLIETQGANNAIERFGNSARRANLISTLGQYGQQQAVMSESLASARSQSERNMQSIGRQHLSADFQTWQGVSMPPMMDASIPAPRFNNANTALMIGNSVMGGLNTFNALKPPK